MDVDLALALLIALALLAAALVGGQLLPLLWRRWRRQSRARQPFPAAWRAVIRRRVPAVARLPAAQQLRLKQLVRVLLAELPFVGCAGFTITDEVRVTIAAQAALLLLGRGGGFNNLREVGVYPGHFVVPVRTPGAGGVVHEGHHVLAGQSWQRGQVLLAWDAVVDGAADPADGRNVVLHEFAHQLDQDNGPANGAPYVGRGPDQARWTQVMRREYAALQQALRRQAVDGGAPLPWLDAYAATDPAEFFAVASEAFFERPQALREARPALYGQLERCYRVDPAQW